MSGRKRKSTTPSDAESSKSARGQSSVPQPNSSQQSSSGNRNKLAPTIITRSFLSPKDRHSPADDKTDNVGIKAQSQLSSKDGSLPVDNVTSKTESMISSKDGPSPAEKNTDNAVNENESLLSSKDEPTRAEDDSRGVYQLKADTKDKAYLLTCPPVEFSRTRYSIRDVHINTEGELINERGTNPPHNDHRLKMYHGTSSTVPLPPCGSPQYWEVKTRIALTECLHKTKLLLEIGLARKEEQDLCHVVGGQSKSYSMTVSNCCHHNSICIKVWRHGNQCLCEPELENTPGTSATLHFGVLYDSARCCVVFFDMKNEKILCKLENVDSSVDLWPVFAVYSRGYATVGMSLIVGNDIDMTESKKALVLEGLEFHE